MKKVILIPVLLCLFFACSDDSPEVDSVLIRLRNTSTLEYAEVYVNTSGGEFNYENISAQGTTPYHQFESAYSYAYVRLKIDGVEHKIQPFDYVGEKNLGNGMYTYEIAAKTSDGPGKLSMTLVRD
jgi:hypothetical protein